MVFFSRPPPEVDVFDPPQAVTRAALRMHERRARRGRRCLMTVLTGVIVEGNAGSCRSLRIPCRMRKGTAHDQSGRLH
jgi:hypothetical protein